MENVKTRRRLLGALTVVSAVLAIPAAFLWMFSVFFFDDPDVGSWAWVMAAPWLTLAATALIAPFVSWVLHARGRYRIAIQGAALPPAHLVTAILEFAVVASVV